MYFANLSNLFVALGKVMKVLMVMTHSQPGFFLDRSSFTRCTLLHLLKRHQVLYTLGHRACATFRLVERNKGFPIIPSLLTCPQFSPLHWLIYSIQKMLLQQTTKRVRKENCKKCYSNRGKGRARKERQKK